MALTKNLKYINALVLNAQRGLSSVAVCNSTNPTYVPPPPPPPNLKREYSEESNPAKCKVAIVTGGARGIGYHIAESLLQAGAQAVILGDVLVDDCEEATCKLNEKYGENKALFQPCDVTNKGQMEKIFKCTKDRFGKLDIVVNNAGVADTDWEKMININVTGLVLGTVLGFQHMGSNTGGKGGHIINVASILGLQPLFSMPVYCGTKWFVIGFTRSMGSDYFYDMTNVKVMAVCPGVTDTVIIDNAGHATLTGFPDLDKEAAKSLGSLPPQGPEEVGRSVIEMLKDGANGSVWVSEGRETYQAIMADRSTYRKNGSKSASPKEDICSGRSGKSSGKGSSSDKHKKHKDSKKDKSKKDKSKDSGSGGKCPK